MAYVRDNGQYAKTFYSVFVREGQEEGSLPLSPFEVAAMCDQLPSGGAVSSDFDVEANKTYYIEENGLEFESINFDYIVDGVVLDTFAVLFKVSGGITFSLDGESFSSINDYWVTFSATSDELSYDVNVLEETQPFEIGMILDDVEIISDIGGSKYDSEGNLLKQSTNISIELNDFASSKENTDELRGLGKADLFLSDYNGKYTHGFCVLGRSLDCFRNINDGLRTNKLKIEASARNIDKIAKF